MKKAWIFICVCIFSLSFSNIANAELSNKAHGWGFVKSKDGVPADAGAELNALVELHGAYYKRNGKEKYLYLTFDNGYENGYTKQVLDVLKKHQVPAAFFVTGHYLETAPDLTKRMVEEGHIVGNHSWSHPDLTTKSEEEIVKELNKVRDRTKELTGQRVMQYLRPPRGVFSARTMDIAKKAGYTHIFWSLAYRDWEVDKQKGADYAYDQVMKQLHPGAIMLIHSVSKDNADALERIIVDAKKQGYIFKSIDDLMLEKELPEGFL